MKRIKNQSFSDKLLFQITLNVLSSHMYTMGFELRITQTRFYVFQFKIILTPQVTPTNGGQSVTSFRWYNMLNNFSKDIVL